MDFFQNGGIPDEHPPEMVRAPLDKVAREMAKLENLNFPDEGSSPERIYQWINQYRKEIDLIDTA